MRLNAQKNDEWATQWVAKVFTSRGVKGLNFQQTLECFVDEARDNLPRRHEPARGTSRSTRSASAQIRKQMYVALRRVGWGTRRGRCGGVVGLGGRRGSVQRGRFFVAELI